MTSICKNDSTSLLRSDLCREIPSRSGQDSGLGLGVFVWGFGGLLGIKSLIDSCLVKRTHQRAFPKRTVPLFV